MAPLIFNFMALATEPHVPRPCPLRGDWILTRGWKLHQPCTFLYDLPPRHIYDCVPELVDECSYLGPIHDVHQCSTYTAVLVPRTETQHLIWAVIWTKDQDLPSDPERGIACGYLVDETKRLEWEANGWRNEFHDLGHES